VSSERGAASVHAVTVVTLLALVAATCLQVALVVGLRQRASAAADLAALAASRASVEGGDGCAAARRIARENGGRLRECRLDAAVATVSVRARGPRWLIGRWATEQRARAAPSWYLD